MIEVETVLVLGAGASWDYGFPTGKELVSWIREACKNTEDPNFRLLSCVLGNEKKVREFAYHLMIRNPPSVDAWLERNADFMDIGKLAIALALLNYESGTGMRKQAKGDWYNLLFEKLDSPLEQFHDNKLSIITFNYDRSLEHALFEMFRHNYTGRTDDDYRDEFRKLKILHVYGSLGRLSWQLGNPWLPKDDIEYGGGEERQRCLTELAGYTETFRSLQTVEKIVRSAADSIEIVPQAQEGLPKKFEQARKLILNAQAVYFLGFGYHKTNMERLGISSGMTERLTGLSSRKVMGTAYGLTGDTLWSLEKESRRALCRERKTLRNETVYDFVYRVAWNDPNLPKWQAEVPRWD